MFSLTPVALAVAGILLASSLYKSENSKPQSIATTLGGLYTAAHKKFYMDELYMFITQKIIFNLIGKPAAWIDKNIVDGLMNLFADTTAQISDNMKGLQSGKLQQYASYFFVGVLGFMLLFIYLWN